MQCIAGTWWITEYCHLYWIGSIGSIPLVTWLHTQYGKFSGCLWEPIYDVIIDAVKCSAGVNVAMHGCYGNALLLWTMPCCYALLLCRGQWPIGNVWDQWVCFMLCLMPDDTMSMILSTIKDCSIIFFWLAVHKQGMQSNYLRIINSSVPTISSWCPITVLITLYYDSLYHDEVVTFYF